MITKFIENAARSDMTNGRLESWLVELSYWNWFGHGSNFYYEVDVLGHSTWISHLSQYGLASTSLFIGMLIYIIIWAWVVATRNQQQISAVLLSTILGFMVNASFETGASTPGLVTSIVLFAIVFQQKKSI